MQFGQTCAAVAALHDWFAVSLWRGPCTAERARASLTASQDDFVSMCCSGSRAYLPSTRRVASSKNLRTCDTSLPMWAGAGYVLALATVCGKLLRQYDNVLNRPPLLNMLPKNGIVTRGNSVCQAVVTTACLVRS